MGQLVCRYRVVAKKDAGKCFGASLMRDPELVGECLRWGSAR
jgi:tRNA-dihydrouridine synthase